MENQSSLNNQDEEIETLFEGSTWTLLDDNDQPVETAEPEAAASEETQEADKETQETADKDGVKEEEVKEEVEAKTEDLPEEKTDQQTFDSVLDEMSGGEIKSIEAFREAQILEKAGQYEVLTNRTEELQRELEAAKQGNDLFANDLMRAANQLFKDGKKEDALSLLSSHSLDVENMSPDEALRHQISSQNPKLSMAQIQAHINHKYGQNSEDPDEIEQGKISMTIDGNEAKRAILSGRKSLEVAEPEDRAKIIEEQAAKRMESWEPIINKTAKAVKSIETEIDGESFKFELDDKAQAALKDQLYQTIEMTDMDTTPADQKEAFEIATNIALLSNRQAFVDAIVKQARSKEKEKSFEEEHNSSSQNTSDPKPKEEKPAAIGDLAYKFALAEVMGGEA